MFPKVGDKKRYENDKMVRLRSSDSHANYFVTSVGRGSTLIGRGLVMSPHSADDCSKDFSYHIHFPTNFIPCTFNLYIEKFRNNIDELIVVASMITPGRSYSSAFKDELNHKIPGLRWTGDQVVAHFREGDVKLAFNIIHKHCPLPELLIKDIEDLCTIAGLPNYVEDITFDRKAAIGFMQAQKDHIERKDPRELPDDVLGEIIGFMGSSKGKRNLQGSDDEDPTTGGGSSSPKP